MKTSLLTIYLFLAFAASLQSQSYLWSKSNGGSGTDVGYGITNDISNNVYSTGSYAGTANFGGGGITSGGEDDMFLVKYNIFGIHQFTKSFGGLGNQVAHDVVVGPTGNIYLIGFFEDSIKFDPSNVLYGIGNNDGFLVKLDPTGSYMWGKVIAGSQNIIGNGIDLDQNENVFITGTFEGTTNFNGSNYTSNGGKDGFLAKYDKNGNPIWFQKTGGLLDDTGNDLVLDPAGNVYGVGSFLGLVNFGGSFKLSAGFSDAYVTKFTNAGVQSWTTTFGGLLSDTGNAIDIDSNDDLFVTGDFQGLVDFGGGGLTSGGSDDIFLIKMNSSGGFMWASRFGSSGEDESHGVAIDYRDNVYITGRFFNTVDFGGGGLTSGGNDDIFSVGFTGGGDYIYSISYGSTGSDMGNAISADGNGDIHITGSIGGNINLGGGIIPAKGGTDAFSLASSPALILPIRLLDFSLEKEGTSVDLSWTLSEVEEGSSFELERGDNPSGFQSIGSFFPSKENCDLCVFNWHDPYLSPGTYYYRLKSIDQDNNTTYSTLLSTVILLEDPDQMKHYFNPYTQSLSIWIQAEKNNLGNISIRNIEGKKVYQFDLLSNGKHEFDLSRYPIGFYILEYSNYSNLEYEKITIY